MDLEQLEQLSFLIKTKQEQDNLIQRYLYEKKKLENTEFHKQMQKMRKQNTHYVCVTPCEVSNK